ncbi:ATP-binding protein [Neolewinella agarilytica]|uniref:ATP-binding protein n=1 Tax=Neolewinella agarilytica TaxID=478744 RepID=UPI002356575C|nr:ATP-binding protein [Neolewinella agarilytica]
MKFYGRKEELSVLSEAKKRSFANSQMTVVIGRRRVGKTRLILQSLSKDDYLYFFVSKKAESLLCLDFVQQIKEVYGEEPIGRITQFQQVFKFICQLARKHHVNLVIDEFQDFSLINPSVFSEIQRDWDLNKEEVKLNLIICGSVQSMMNRIFLDSREPLFGRASSILKVSPFTHATLKMILIDHSPKAHPEDLLALYTITGGTAKYIEHLVERDSLTFSKIIATVFHPQSFFLQEGRNALIADLGKDHTVYFSILSLISNGFTTRPKIESVLQRPIGGHINRLERVYNIVKREKPIFSKENSTTIQFFIADNFLRFWFRFIFKYQHMIEAKNYKTLVELVKRDYRGFAGLSLEQFFREQYRNSGEFTCVGNYWERGNQNEIDLVAVDEINKKAIIAEVKWQKKRVSLPRLEVKSENLIKNHLRGYDIKFVALGVEDIPL